MSTRRPRLFLIDGTALAYRSHFAFAAARSGGLSTRAGQPTSAVFGFLTTLRALLDQEQPDAVAVSFDGPREELERTRIYPEYKSTRERMPDEIVSQLPLVERAVRAYGIAVVSSKGHEADDVIGTLAVQGAAAGYEVFIVTGDKDFLQLVGDHIKLWNLRAATRQPEILGAAECQAKFGVLPGQILDLLALMGDSSDNIPGVPKVGEKTAASLLQTFGSLDALLARSAEVPQAAVRKSLEEHRALALLSRDLARIRVDIPLDVELAAIGPPRPDRRQLEALFRELEFESLLKGLPQEQAPDLAQDYRIVRDAAALEELLAGLRQSGGFAVDTETTSLDPLVARLVGMSFCWRAGQAWYVPFNLEPPVLPGGPAEVLERLRPVLEDPALAKTAQNAKYDMGVLRTAEVELRGVECDTMLLSYCLAPGLGPHNLDALALRHFSYRKIPTTDLIGTGKKQKTFDQVDIDLAGRYGAEDADFTWRLREKLLPELEQARLGPLFRELEMPLIPVLLDMEREGICVDLAHLRQIGQTLGTRLDAIEARIYERAGAPFNLNSPAQIGQVLFDKLEVHRAANLKVRKTPTGQYKTDAEILEKLARFHEVPQLILEYRQLAKLKGTYVDSLPEMVHPRTGRIHTTFNQAVAATGRLSSDNPNLQNIPIRTAEGREVRKAFVSRAPEWLLVSADYSQIELRILAHASGDPALVDAFRKDEDIHARTAALVHGILPNMVTPELRNQAKVINYGLMYGMGPSRLAQETGMSPPEARHFIEHYFRALPEVKRFLDRTLEEARRTKEVWTLFGRRRPLPEIDSSDAGRRVAAENMAVNTPIQGSAADIIKRAMLDVHARLAKGRLRARLLLQVHDELVLDVPEEELRVVEALVREAMEGAAKLRVPLRVSLGHGRDWLLAH
ncbi:MAG: DNA polymerase I [Planctomycetes bacterium]|nr:DNA polymerase I [Planctomycetota bacterium]